MQATASGRNGMGRGRTRRGAARTGAALLVGLALLAGCSDGGDSDEDSDRTAYEADRSGADTPSDSESNDDESNDDDESSEGAMAANYSLADITLPSGIGLDYFHETAPRNTGVAQQPYDPPQNEDQIEALYATPGASSPELIINLYERPGEDATRLITSEPAETVQVADDILCGPDGSELTFLCAVQLEDGYISVFSDGTVVDTRGLPSTVEELGELTVEFLRLATEGEPAPSPEALTDVSAATFALPPDLGPVYAVQESSAIEPPPNATTHAVYAYSGPPMFEAAVFPGVTAEAVKGDLRDIQLLRRVECGLNATNGLAVCVVALSDGVLVVNDSELALKDPDAASRFTATLLYELRRAG